MESYMNLVDTSDCLWAHVGDDSLEVVTQWGKEIDRNPCWIFGIEVCWQALAKAVVDQSSGGGGFAAISNSGIVSFV